MTTCDHKWVHVTLRADYVESLGSGHISVLKFSEDDEYDEGITIRIDSADDNELWSELVIEPSDVNELAYGNEGVEISFIAWVKGVDVFEGEVGNSGMVFETPDDIEIEVCTEPGTNLNSLLVMEDAGEQVCWWDSIKSQVSS